MEALARIAQLITEEELFLGRIYRQIEEIDEGTDGNENLERIYAGMVSAYDAAERAMEALDKLHDDISRLLNGEMVISFSQMPTHRAEAIAEYAVAVAYVRRPSAVYAAHVNRQMLHFVQRDAAQVLMDPRLDDGAVLDYMQHLGQSIPSLTCASTAVVETSDGGTSWAERILWGLGGALAKTAWDSRGGGD